MDFRPDETQRLLVASARRWVAERCDFATWQAERRAGRTLATQRWPEMAALGWAALLLPESDGGMGGGPVEAALLAEALAPGLVAEAFLARGVEAAALWCALPASAWRHDIRTRVARGEASIALAHLEPGQAEGAVPSVTRATRATRDSGGWQLDGRKTVVLGGAEADWLVVSAASAEGPLLFAVAPTAAGVVLEPGPTLDAHGAAELHLHGLVLPESARLCAGGAAPSLLARVRDAALPAIGGEALGLMERLFQLTRDHLRTRHQFGQPLARFQALRHRLVDMFMQIEATRSLVLLASLRLAEGDTGAPRALAALKVKLGQAGRFVGQQAIQLHGALGMTDELLVGHAFKRLMALDARWGNADHHLRRISTMPG